MFYRVCFIVYFIVHAAFVRIKLMMMMMMISSVVVVVVVVDDVECFVILFSAASIACK